MREKFGDVCHAQSRVRLHGTLAENIYLSIKRNKASQNINTIFNRTYNYPLMQLSVHINASQLHVLRQFHLCYGEVFHYLLTSYLYTCNKTQYYVFNIQVYPRTVSFCVSRQVSKRTQFTVPEKTENIFKQQFTYFIRIFTAMFNHSFVTKFYFKSSYPKLQMLL